MNSLTAMEELKILDMKKRHKSVSKYFVPFVDGIKVKVILNR